MIIFISKIIMQDFQKYQMNRLLFSNFTNTPITII
ncbi:hypothetical protein QE441_002970 [Chryseobacterium sp. SORGH_AS909]|uniref:Uncharacterized protein n=1 Tax=Chryseobacterium camelliae TaxID=1265445 RepID=A0ABU0TFQ7_9FLAO|nr:hypothetical protein [Chryseobacterium camelliae]MDQ1099830.1 hypothetical protein [Chryseobacterium sp. SORGH_AS_1048]MDR6087176.1 hypothetical protein [Chryseobacterium sp. SORGH_AS_0909]MDR6131550.1 hypothetical protein [Chryseobacterium sp. SORGH_AS_1175]MDT3406308.1 hypothetical protein [Pseudacidovorax intermedius]